MTEDRYESRFICKLCNKRYPCGKSLGGHMRSHVVANSESKSKKFVDGGSGNGYVLRENPKKTWRSGLPTGEDQVCKQCGKVFQSLKALCGHMACHSDREKSSKDDHSWTGENPRKNLSFFDSESDTEEGLANNRLSRSKSCKKLMAECSSSVSEIDGQGEEEVAMCLMLLSMDSANKGGVNSVVESSDNNSVVMETKSWSTGKKEGSVSRENGKMVSVVHGVLDDGKTAKIENSDSGYFLDECGKDESDASVDWFRRNYSGIESRKREYESGKVTNRGEKLHHPSQKRSKYECFNCKKVFKSYQALGGHRPCHKRSNAGYENSPDEYRTSNSSKKSKAKSSKGHVCPFCSRVFKNGQALGGHKRSHLIGLHDDSNNRSSVVKREPPDLLDLNLPAPEAGEDDGSGHFFSW